MQGNDIVYAANLNHTRYSFPTLREMLAVASPPRSGDELAGIAARSAEHRVAARLALADLPITAFLRETVIPYEADEITRLIVDGHKADLLAPVSHMTMGEFREWLLSDQASSEALSRLAPGLTPEMVAGVSKLMRNQDLVTVAKKCRVVTAFRSHLGTEGSLAIRLQPNHPTDDPKGIAASIADGLMLGAGDAVIGINPASDDLQATSILYRLLDDIREKLGVPTQSCVLSHITTTIAAIERSVPVDLVFQSIAGTEAANRGFGIDLQLLREGHAAGLSTGRASLGENVMYFETGQGSALSADAHHDVDQQTIETRAYAVAREFRPLLVNSVVGFIGPEYLYDGKQIIRAGLEDHFCGKLLGLPMGVDICYTNHAEADQDDMDCLLTMLGLAGVTFIIGVPGADDVMLNYQSTSFHDGLYIRNALKLKAAPEFQLWLDAMGFPRDIRSLERLPAAISDMFVDRSESGA
jgi:ethanolamine ammonia-lyase large subunit